MRRWAPPCRRRARRSGVPRPDPWDRVARGRRSGPLGRTCRSRARSCVARASPWVSSSLDRGITPGSMRFRIGYSTTVAALLVAGAVGGCGGGSKSTTSTTSSTPSRPTVQTTDWPTYGFDQGRTRYLPTNQVKPPFQVAWRYDARHLMEYSPIVVGDTLYGIDNN